VTIPYSSSKDDIKKVKKNFGDNGVGIKVVARIDTITGVENYEDIIQEADAVIFLGNEI